MRQPGAGAAVLLKLAHAWGCSAAEGTDANDEHMALNAGVLVLRAAGAAIFLARQGRGQVKAAYSPAPPGNVKRDRRVTKATRSSQAVETPVILFPAGPRPSRRAAMPGRRKGSSERNISWPASSCSGARLLWAPPLSGQRGDTQTHMARPLAPKLRHNFGELGRRGHSPAGCRQQLQRSKGHHPTKQ